MAIQGTYVPSAATWVREHVELYESTNGQEGRTLPGTDDPVVVITSIGAESGHVRKNPVMRVEREGRYLAVASMGGAPEDPAWAENFRRHPEVDLQDGADKASYSVRELSGDEREQWWEYAVATWPTYADYKAKTDPIGRTIPLFLLERLSE